MIASIYELIGRLVVRVAWLRFGKQVKLAGGLVAALALLLGYLVARRQPPEG